MSVEDPTKSGQPERRDEELMALLQGGHDEPLDALIKRHRGELLRFFLLRSKDHHVAQDLTNETFYRIFAKARTFEPTKPFKPWFYAVATNVWRAWQRRRPSEVPLSPLPETVDAQSFADAFPGREIATQILEQLSEIDREILLLRHYEGLKLKEIARRLGLSPGAVYTRLFRALEKLRRSGPRVDSV